MIQINNELRDRAYKCACDHGFHDKEYSDSHWLALIITEIGEAIDADRKNKHSDVETFKIWENFGFYGEFEKYIKNSMEDELSDIVIRCLDFAGLRKIDLHDLPLIMNYRISNIVGEGKLFTEIMLEVAGIIFIPPKANICVLYLIAAVFSYTNEFKIDLRWHIEQKMRYNEMRPMLNGKKY